jgi:hypothetical protein
MDAKLLNYELIIGDKKLKETRSYNEEECPLSSHTAVITQF